MIKCKVCEKELKSYTSLSKHIKIHKISVKEYYDIYICGNNKCLNCGLETKFVSMNIGYKKFCTHKCSTEYNIGKRRNSKSHKQIIYTIKCEICNKLYKNLNGLSKHIITHSITSEEYYLKYLGKKQYCKECGKDTKFKSLIDGYQIFCSSKCCNNNKDKINKFKKSYLLNDIKKVYKKRQQTNLKLYGNVIANRNDNIKEKSRLNFLKNQAKKKIYLLKEYDLEPLVSLTEKTILNPIQIKCKKCGKIFNDTIFNISQRMYKCSCQRPKTGSVNENKIKDYIIKILPDKKLIFNEKIDGYEFDILIPDKKIAIEYNGLYWHSENILKNPKEYHLYKKEICKKHNINLIQIFEDEWINKEQIVKNRIAYLLNDNCITRIYARKCIIKNISYQEKKAFLETHHIQGNDISSINIGAFYNNKLVSVMTFSKGNISKGSKFILNHWELSRYCSDGRLSVVGIASKLLTYFKRNYIWEYIYSYADARWSNGKLYLKIGFTFEYMTKPNYWYTHDGYKRIHRFKLRKRPDEPKDIPEWILRQKEGYYRIWDCGNYKFSIINNNYNYKQSL